MSILQGKLIVILSTPRDQCKFTSYPYLLLLQQFVGIFAIGESLLVGDHRPLTPPEKRWARGGSLFVATTGGSWACGGLLSVAITGEVGPMGDCCLLEMLEEVRIVGGHRLLNKRMQHLPGVQGLQVQKTHLFAAMAMHPATATGNKWVGDSQN